MDPTLPGPVSTDTPGASARPGIPDPVAGAPEPKAKKPPRKVPKPLVPPVAPEGKDNEQERVTACQALFTEAWEFRRSREALDMDCFAFARGDQYGRWSVKEHRFVTDDQTPSWRVRETRNMIAPTIEQMVSILTVTRPVLRPRPATGDREDEDTADVGAAILDKTRLDLNFAGLDRILKTQKSISGTSALEIEFDSYSGPFEAETETDEDPESPTFGDPVLVHDEDGNQVFKARGRFRARVWNGIEFLADPVSPFRDDWRYLITATTRNRKQLERETGKEIGTGGGEATGSGGTPGTMGRIAMQLQKLRSFVGGKPEAKLGSAPNRADDVEVLRIHLAPSIHEPGGRLIVMAGDRILYDDVSPARGLWRFPVWAFYHTFDGTSPYGDGVVKHLLDLQRDYNKTVSQMIEHRNLMLKGKWLVPRGCEIEQEAITSEPGEIIEYVSTDAWMKPEQVRPQPIDGSYFQLLNSDQEAFYRIAGIGEATRGESVPNIRTGRGLEVLKSGNAERLQNVIKADFEVWRDVGSYILWLAGQHWDDGTLIRVAGRNTTQMMKAFRKAKFQEPFDVIVENDDALPTDPIDRLQVLGAMFGQGGIMSNKDLSPADKALYFQMAKFSDINRFIEQQNLDEVNTRRKVSLIVDEEPGIPQVADNFEEHATCIRVLADYFKTHDYYALTPEKRQMLTDLHASHAAYLAPPPVNQPQPTPPMPGGSPVAPGAMTPEAIAASAEQPQAPAEGSPPSPQAMPQ